LTGPRSFTGRGLSDNGSSYISADLAKWIDGQNMNHVRGSEVDSPTDLSDKTSCCAQDASPSLI